MSMCIYQGFLLKTDSLAEVSRIVEAFRPWVTSQAEHRYDQFMDNMVTSGKTETEAFALWRDFRDRVRKEGVRVPIVDTDFSISLIPVNGGLLGIVYTEHRAWYEAWCQQPGVEEFSYWDNADAPDEMAESEWQLREKAWAVLTGQPVAMQAFSIDLVSPNGPLPKAWR